MYNFEPGHCVIVNNFHFVVKEVKEGKWVSISTSRSLNVCE